MFDFVLLGERFFASPFVERPGDAQPRTRPAPLDLAPFISPDDEAHGHLNKHLDKDMTALLIASLCHCPLRSSECRLRAAMRRSERLASLTERPTRQ